MSISKALRPAEINRLSASAPFTLASAVAFFFGLVTGNFDLPDIVRQTLLGVGSVGLAVSLVLLGWQNLFRRLPWPWLPRQSFRILRWLSWRPRLGILIVNTPVSYQSNTGSVEQCDVGVIVAEGAPREGRSLALRYDDAELILQQRHGGKFRRFVFAPSNVPAELGAPRTSEDRNVHLLFRWRAGSDQITPNFAADYQLILTGVRAAVASGRARVDGVLPAMTWTHDADAFRAVATTA